MTGMAGTQILGLTVTEETEDCIYQDMNHKWWKLNHWFIMQILWQSLNNESLHDYGKNKMQGDYKDVITKM